MFIDSAVHWIVGILDEGKTDLGQRESVTLGIYKCPDVLTLKKARVEEPARQPYSIISWLAKSSNPFTVRWVVSELLEELRLEK